VTARWAPRIDYVTTHGASNPWVANEVRTVRAAGVPVRLHAMRRTAAGFHRAAWLQALHDETRAIYPLSWRDVVRALVEAPFVFRGRLLAAAVNALFGRRESLRVRVVAAVHLVVACVWALELRRDPPALIHAQWIHSCGTIGMYGAWLLDVPFGFTGHATDLFRDRCALADKIRRARYIVCISSFHRDFFLREGAPPERLVLAHCGVDPTLFPFVRPERAPGAPSTPLRIRSSGRLVEKKGFDDLIDACHALAERGVAFECTIAGSGPLEAALRDHAARVGLADRVTVTGEPLHQEDIPGFLHGGDVYALPCVPAADGDVDGLPIVLMEAMACGLPAVSTRLVGIPDLVVDGQTGLLVEPHDVSALADAIEALGADAGLADRLARAGREQVCREFDLATCLEPLVERYREALDEAREALDEAREAPAEPAS
jgi:colanic acid/amylovoran biosynthesis glycosyltransferase